MTLAATLAGQEWLQRGALPRIFDLLDRDGEEARVVGGAVRNALLGLPVEEFDLATTAVPDVVMQRAKAGRIRAVPTGIEHGTVTLIVEGRPYEVTTLRQDVETYGRRARVEFGRDWRRDAERRDFTMNALSAGRDGTLYDYVGGLADLAARRVRFIGEARQRIAEDYLRILRFFRFHAVYGEGEPDPVALAACIAGRDGLESLSRERVRMELFKLLIGRRAVDAVTAMSEAGLLVRILGGAAWVNSLRRLVALEARLRRAPDALLRLAALAAQVSEDADRLFERLRLSNAEYQRLLSAMDGWWRIDSRMPRQAAQSLLYRLGAERFVDRVLLAWSRAADADASGWVDMLAMAAGWPVPKFPISASDLMARGVGPGPALGTALRAAEEAWIAAGFPLDAEAVQKIAKQEAEKARRSAEDRPAVGRQSAD